MVFSVASEDQCQGAQCISMGRVCTAHHWAVCDVCSLAMTTWWSS